MIILLTELLITPKRSFIFVSHVDVIAGKGFPKMRYIYEASVTDF